MAELLAGAGFDWLLFDTEHSPADPITVLEQLQAAAAYPVSSVVRAAWNDTVLIKRFLDVGAQTLLLPYVQDAARGAGGGGGDPLSAAGGARGQHRSAGRRASGGSPTIPRRAEEELCLLVQVETAEALGEIEAIAAVDGIDGIFVGPADLAASLGHPGAAGHPEVVAAIEDAIARIGRAGKPAGILTPDRDFARRCLELGAVFVAVGVDAALLAAGERGAGGGVQIRLRAKVYGDLLDAHIMHNACTTHMLSKRVRIESLT